MNLKLNEIIKKVAEIHLKNLSEGRRLISNSKLLLLNFSEVLFNLPYSKVDILEYLPADTLLSLIGKIGGQLSLWAGITFIVLLDVIVLIFDLSAYCYKRWGNTNQNDITPEVIIVESHTKN